MDHTTMEGPSFTVLVKASGSRVDGVRVESVNEPEKAPTSVTFITKAGKRWKMRLEEFSFVFNAKKAKAEPAPANPPTPATP